MLNTGCEKLGYGSLPGCCIAEECDGTLIDEDEILMEKTKEVLMILKPGEAWNPVSQLSSDSKAVKEPFVDSSHGDSVIAETNASSVIAVSSAVTDSAATTVPTHQSPMPIEGS